MRYRTEIEFGVPDFDDLLKIQQYVREILEVLRVARTSERVDVTFRWYKVTHDLGVNIQAQFVNQSRGCRSPEGIKAEDLALLVCVMVENYLLAGDLFEKEEVSGDHEKMFFTLRLKRVRRK